MKRALGKRPRRPSRHGLRGGAAVSAPSRATAAPPGRHGLRGGVAESAPSGAPAAPPGRHGLRGGAAESAPSRATAAPARPARRRRVGASGIHAPAARRLKLSAAHGTLLAMARARRHQRLLSALAFSLLALV